jgi:hypothetical protein
MGSRYKAGAGSGAKAPPPLIDSVFDVEVACPGRKPAAGLPRRLAGLFRDLTRDPPPREPDDIEDLIWAHWIAHPTGSACSLMTAAIEAIDAGALDLARPMLDRLVEAQPGWAEAWNKRATLAFIEKRDGDALHDIRETLLLEPRHFGAVSGFGQICLRAARFTEARAAFQVALAINPHLRGLREAVAELSEAPSVLFH